MMATQVSSQSTPTPSEDGGSINPEDINVSFLVEDIFEQMQKKFTTVGNSIMGRMDEMGRRMDELERSVGGLMDQAGLPPEQRTPSGMRHHLEPNAVVEDDNDNIIVEQQDGSSSSEPTESGPTEI